MKKINCLLIMTLIAGLTAASGCKKYPLALGSSNDWTYLLQFDLSSSQDEVISAYRSFDCNLLSPCYVDAGILVLHQGIASSSSTITIKWATHVAVGRFAIYGVAFSTNASQIIVHTNQQSGAPNNEQIWILNSANGAVVTGRSYDGGSYASYDPMVRGLILTDDDLKPQAYVFSQTCPYQSGTALCQYVFFRFTANLASTSSTWARKSISTSAKALGATINDETLFLFSYETSSLMIQMVNAGEPGTHPSELDAAMVSFPQQPDSQAFYQNAFTAIGGATSSITPMVFLRIIADSTTRLITQMDAYTPTGLSATNKLRDIYMDPSEFDIFSVLYQQVSSGVNHLTYFARVNVANSSFVHWSELPKNSIANAVLGRFITESTYLVGGHNQETFTTSLYGSTQTLGTRINGLIYSNIQADSCYEVASVALDDISLQTYGAAIQASAGRLTSVTISFSQVNPVLFNVRTQYKISINAWCSVADNVLSVDASTPNQYAVDVGVAETFNINAFSYCGSNLPVIAYSLSVQSSTSPVPNWLSMPSTSPELTILDTSQAGIYNLQIDGLVGSYINTFKFNLIIISGPYFEATLVIQQILIGQADEYVFPSVFVLEGRTWTATATLTSVVGSSCATLADVAAASPPIFVFDEVLMTMTTDLTSLPTITGATWACTYEQTIVLTDSSAREGTYTIDFEFVEPNYPPNWVDGAPEPISIHVGKILNYVLPPFADANGETVTVTNIVSPVFAVFSAPSGFTITPTSASHIGQSQISARLTDPRGLTLPFTIDITVLNDPPFLESTPLDQLAYAGDVKTYTLPIAQDFESPLFDPLIVTDIIESSLGVLPPFIFFNADERTFTFTPEQTNIGNHTIIFALVDQAGASTQYSFKLSVMSLPQPTQAIPGLSGNDLNTGAPEFSVPLVTSLTIEEGKTASIQLPDIVDPDGNEFIMTYQLGSSLAFVKKEGSKFIASPQAQHVSATPYTVSITLKDLDGSNGFISKSNTYQIKITVTAKPQNEANTTQEAETSTTSNAYNVITEGNFNDQSKQKKDKKDQNGQIIERTNEVARIKLVKVTQNGIASLKIRAYNEEYFSQKITNKTFKIRVSTREVGYNVNYTVQSVDAPYISLKLTFVDPSTLSNSQESDILQIRTTLTLTVQTETMIERMPENTVIEAYIPLQISNSQAEAQQKIQDTGEAASYALLGSNLLMNLFLQVVIFQTYLGLEFFLICSVFLMTCHRLHYSR